MEGVQDHPNRRSGIDRRAGKQHAFNRYQLTGRRVEPRRKADQRRSQVVDRYSARILVIITLILVLSILDAAFTLWLVEKGARELNPFMAYYLKKSPLMFICVKYFLTCAAVLLVFFNKDKHLFKTKAKVKILLLVLPIPFFMVISWQMHLIFFWF